MVDFADRWDLQNRRSMLKNIFQGMTLGRASSPEESLRGQVAYANGDHLGLPGGFIALEVYPERHWDPDVEEVPDYLTLMPGLGWAGARPAHRSEAIPPGAGPNPEPLDTQIEGMLHPVVVRHWQAGSTQTCRRCLRCNACPSKEQPGQEVCLVELDRYDGPRIAPKPEPEPEPDREPSWAELKFQRRLVAIKRRNALREARRTTGSLVLDGV